MNALDLQDSSHPSGDDAQILLVDDDPDILSSLSDLLELEGGYEVYQAGNVANAEKIIAEVEPDIALIDLKLGQSNGLDLIQSVKQSYPMTSCVVMTAYRDVVHTPMAVRSGADDYLYKPLNPSDLLRTLENLLIRSRLQRDNHAFAAQFQAVFEQTFQYLFLLKPGGELVEANQAAMNLIDTPASDLAGKQFWRSPWFDFKDVNYATKRQNDLQIAVAKAATGEFIRHETELQSIRDEVTTVDFSLKPVRNENNEVYQLIAEARDISERKRMEQAVRESESQLSLLLESTTEGIYGIDTGGNCTFVNSACLKMLGYEIRAQMLGKNMHELIHHSNTDGTPNPQSRSRVLSSMQKKTSVNVDDELLWRADGSSFPAEYCSSVMYRDDTVVGCVVNFLDISKRKAAEQKLHLAGKVVEHAMEAIVVTDSEARIVEINPAFCDMFGYTLEEVVGRKVSYFRNGENNESYRQMWDAIYQQGQWRGELKDRRKNGEEFPILLSVSSVKEQSGKVSHYVGLASDISRLKQSEERLEYMAYYDPLTGLPNRALFRERLEGALSNVERHKRQMAVLFIDLDRFKYVNDSLGHGSGDKLLKEVASRLQKCIRAEDTVARYSGDEFTAILSEISGSQTAEFAARRIVNSLSHPFQLEGTEVYVTASVGVALYPWDSQDVDTLIKNADIAMYRAKSLGKNRYQLFNKNLNVKAQERLLLENGLRDAIKRDQMLLHYQPKVDITSGEIVGVEALLRWHHPEMGNIPPVKFIPVAEESGLIIPIGEFVFRQVCQQINTWKEQNIFNIPVAINVSARQFLKSDFCTMIGAILGEYQLEANSIEIEITESIMMDDIENHLETLNTLRDMGLHILIDDFGKGYSSFNYLNRLPVTALKIDKSFVDGLLDKGNEVHITSAIISMAKSMNLDVVAEGVEHMSQLRILKEYGCKGAQGFLFSKPVSGDKIQAVIEQIRTGFISEGQE